MKRYKGHHMPIGVADLPHSTDTITKLLSDKSYSSVLNPNIKDDSTIEELDVGYYCSVSYERYPGGSCLASDRDVCLLNLITSEGHDTVFFQTSVEHAECPPVKKVIRAENIMSGVILKPDPTYHDSQCRVIYYHILDFKGSYTKKMINQNLGDDGLWQTLTSKNITNWESGKAAGK